MKLHTKLPLTLLGFIVFCSLALAGQAKAQGGPPTQFRGIEFGAPLDQVEGLTPVSEKVARDKEAYEGLYFREDEDLHFGEAAVRSVAYYFYKDRLSSVIIAVEGDVNAFLVKDALIAEFGEGRQIGRRYGWTWDEFSLVMERAMDKETSVLTYTYEPRD